MDDSIFPIPDQPNPVDDDRPDGADQAADIARAKLNAIYESRQPTADGQSQAPQQAPAAPPAAPQPAPVQPQPQPVQPTHYQEPTLQPTQAEASPFVDHSPTDYQLPVQPSQQATEQPAGYSEVEPSPAPQVAQPEPQPAPSQQYQEPNIIQPDLAYEPAAEPSYDSYPDNLQTSYQSQPMTPAEPATQGYIPKQQYAQEVSLEEQIDELKHYPPDHQLPAHSQGSARKSLIPYHLQPLLRTLGLALIVAVIYNHQFLVGQVQSYINPAQSVVSPAIIAPNTEQTIGDESRIIIPKLNVDVPVVYDVTTFDEDEVQAGLERGVVHYGTTALPGENGNNVIVGHSSNNFWNNGDYKFAFVLLNKLDDGDTFTLHYEGTAYTYEVFRKKIVAPTDVNVVFEDFGEPVVTLITCDPPGTSWNRLIVNARQISPDPDQASQPQQQQPTPDEIITVPGDNQSLVDRLFN